jgi:RNA polymerase sigma-70 factor (ECF subfamily)
MQSGCKQSFTALYLHYSPRLYTNILGMVHDKILAEELVQELFTRIWQKRESRGMTENFSGYLYKTAQNLVHDFFRRLRRDRTLLERFSRAIAEKYENMEASIHLSESVSLLKNAIEQLPTQQKKVYKLVKENGLTYKKTAEHLGISPLTVKEYLVSANKSIRNYLLSRTDSPQELLLPLLVILTLV